ncbi:hypothetical protein Tco_1241320, partial [Tanacetum coccineum]
NLEEALAVRKAIALLRQKLEVIDKHFVERMRFDDSFETDMDMVELMND